MGPLSETLAALTVSRVSSGGLSNNVFQVCSGLVCWGCYSRTWPSVRKETNDVDLIYKGKRGLEQCCECRLGHRSHLGYKV